jgi:hypothetical protein
MTAKIICLLTGLLVIYSCSPMDYSQVPGKYVSSSRDSKTTIVFKEDARFTFSQNNMGVIRTCAGKWELVSERKLNIKCDDQREDLEKVLSSGYMEPLKEEVLLKGKRKIKMGNLVLMRQK